MLQYTTQKRIDRIIKTATTTERDVVGSGTTGRDFLI